MVLSELKRAITALEQRFDLLEENVTTFKKVSVQQYRKFSRKGNSLQTQIDGQTPNPYDLSARK